LICALTAGWVTPSDAAALVKLRKSTTATRVRSSSVGMFNIILANLAFSDKHDCACPRINCDSNLKSGR
jgi:hypothetical protein